MVSRVAVLLALGGCDWVLGLGQVHPPSDGSTIAPPPSDAMPVEDCRNKLNFVEQPLLFPGFDAVSSPTIRGDLQEAYDIEDDLNGTNIHRWILDPRERFVPADASVLNSGSERDPSVTADGLEIAFVSSRNNVDLMYLAERDRADQPWGQPVLMPGLEGALAEAVSLSADGLTLYAVNGSNAMFQFQRGARVMPFDVNGTAVASNIIDPTVSTDGLELISEINPTDTMVGLYEQIRDNTVEPFSHLTPIALPGVTAYEPDLTPDGHILLTSHMRFFTRSCQ